MISVLICRRRQDDWDIDTWLMSCRVLGRRVEAAVLQELIGQARARGIRRLLGRYLPTEKNRLVEDHYAKLGFTLVEQRADGSTLWELHVADAPAAALPMTVQRLGFESSPPERVMATP
jgi:predicted enzyme involved in methoxymalonyl-ACP biosynthesis